MNNEIIYHLITEDEWEKVSQFKYYEPVSLETEGFIHFSFKDQIDEVIKRYYRNIDSLLILKVDSSRIESKLKIEEVPVNGWFPHLYGKLNLNAVVDVYKIHYGNDGQYYWVE